MKVLVMLAAAVFGSASFAASVGTITLSGSVNQINEIEISENDSAQELDIIEGESGMLVASVTEISNSSTGYTIYMNSLNNSNLVNTSSPGDSTEYTVSYDGGPNVSLTTADQAVKTVGSLSGLVTDTSDVHVQVNGLADAATGTYMDVVTLSIAAN